MKLQWQNEKGIIEQIRKLKVTLEELSMEETRYEREGNLSKAAEIKHGRIPEVQRQLEAKSKELENLHGETRLLREEVSEEDIARIVSNWTGIPVSKMLASEKIEAPEAGGDPGKARRRPEGGHRRRGGRHPPEQVGALRHLAAHGHVPVPRARRASGRPSLPRPLRISFSATRRRSRAST